MPGIETFTVDANTSRAEVYVAKQLEISRSQALKLFKQSKVQINAIIRVKPGPLRTGDVVTVDTPSVPTHKPEFITLHEDDQVLVIDKPSGVLTQARGGFETEPTLESLVTSTGVERHGIVHRLDRATSGVMVLAKSQAAFDHLKQQFAERTVKKTYNAVISEPLKNSPVRVDAPIARQTTNPSLFRVHASGKPATTTFTSRGKVHRGHLIEAQPLTGRTHQIRVHLQYIGRPIIGDSAYGSAEHAERLMLHAAQIAFDHPSVGPVSYKSPLPAEFRPNDA